MVDPVVRASRRASKSLRVPPDWDLPRDAFVYPDPSSTTLRTRAVAEYLREVLGLRVTVRKEFFRHAAGGDLEGLSRRIAATRVRNLLKPFEPVEPVYGEVQFELRLLKDPKKRVPGILYDGYRYASLLRDLLPASERSLRVLHIVFAHRLLGTFDEDGRYHARAVVCGFPSVVSTSGIVEAPAKPKEYYHVKARLSAALGAVPFEAAKAPFAGRFVDYDDPRLSEVAKGYALQAATYAITKEPFCDVASCRLFNAHWQEELLASQIESGRLCPHHEDVAHRIRSAVARRRQTERRSAGASR